MMLISFLIKCHEANGAPSHSPVDEINSGTNMIFGQSSDNYQYLSKSDLLSFPINYVPAINQNNDSDNDSDSDGEINDNEDSDDQYVNKNGMFKEVNKQNGSSRN